jgi:hypothetical protein
LWPAGSLWGKVERGEAGRGKVKMAGGERPQKKQNPKLVGRGGGSFCFFQVGSAAVWLEVGLGLGFFLWIPTTLQNCPSFLCVLKTSIYRQKYC